MNKFPAVAGLTLAALLLGPAACGAGGGTESPSSPRPEISADRATPTRTARTQEVAATETARAKATPTRTGELSRTTEPAPTTEPARTAEPARTTQPARTAEPVKTAEAARTTTPAGTTEPARTTEPAPAAAPTATTVAPTTPAASSSAVAVSTTDGGLGLLGWLLVFALFGILIAVVLVSRSRRVAGWRAEAAALATETRTVLDVRLNPVLARQTAAERDLAWPGVRDGLAGLEARWAGLSTRAPETAGQASAAQTAGLLEHLIAAVDAESDALAAGADWRPLRAQVDADLDALAVALGPQPAPGTPPGEPGPAAYAG